MMQIIKVGHIHVYGNTYAYIIYILKIIENTVVSLSALYVLNENARCVNCKFYNLMTYIRHQNNALYQ